MSLFKGQTYVGVREFYNAEGEMKPGAKVGLRFRQPLNRRPHSRIKDRFSSPPIASLRQGLNMNLDQWQKLVVALPRLSAGLQG